MNRTRIRAAAAAAVLLGLLLLPSAPALGASCPLGVSPSSGPPGTRFTFNGHGYTPTEVRLTRDDHPTKVRPLDLNGADPFTFSIVASQTDVGTWHVVAVEDGDRGRRHRCRYDGGVDGDLRAGGALLGRHDRDAAALAPVRTGRLIDVPRRLRGGRDEVQQSRW